MDILPSGNIFRELQDIHDTGYFSSQASIEDQWQQASFYSIYLLCWHIIEMLRIYYARMNFYHVLWYLVYN